MTLNLSPATLERIELIATHMAPPFGPMEKAVLLVIGIADRAMPDPEAEPSLGWTNWLIGAGPHPIPESPTDRAGYQHSHCCDFEEEHDGLEWDFLTAVSYSDDPNVPQYIDFQGSEVSK